MYLPTVLLFSIFRIPWYHRGNQGPSSQGICSIFMFSTSSHNIDLNKCPLFFEVPVFWPFVIFALSIIQDMTILFYLHFPHGPRNFYFSLLCLLWYFIWYKSERKQVRSHFFFIFNLFCSVPLRLYVENKEKNNFSETWSTY